MMAVTRTIYVDWRMTYEMDVVKVKADFKDEIASDMACGLTEEQALQESFYELCGPERDQDHIDGSYVWRTDDDIDIEGFDT
jgi:hypothetical protein